MSITHAQEESCDLITGAVFHVETVVPESLGQRLRTAMSSRGAKNADIARAAGVHVKTVSQWLGDKQVPDAVALDRVAALLGVPVAWLRYGKGAIASEAGIVIPDASDVAESFQRNPAFRRRLPPKPYARVYEHIDRMVVAGCSAEQLDEAERLMIDGAYNKLNARDPRERTDEEMILDIDDAWDWIKEVLGRAGVKGL